MMCRTEHPARRMETDFNMTKDDGMWKIKHIYDGDYGCEERDQDDRAMVSVTLLQDTGEEKIITLSTCTSRTETERFVVIARLVNIEKN